MSKRTLIITGIAVLMVLAAVFSIYLEKKQLVDIYEGMQPEEDPESEPEEDPEPEPEEKPKRSPGRPPKKENLGFTVAEEKPSNDVENETSKPE